MIKAGWPAFYGHLTNKRERFEKTAVLVTMYMVAFIKGFVL
jgi:hypothetical protein